MRLLHDAVHRPQCTVLIESQEELAPLRSAQP
jgi:hypothetical protein